MLRQQFRLQSRSVLLSIAVCYRKFGPSQLNYKSPVTDWVCSVYSVLIYACVQNFIKLSKLFSLCVEAQDISRQLLQMQQCHWLFFRWVIRIIIMLQLLNNTLLKIQIETKFSDHSTTSVYTYPYDLVIYS